VFWSPVVAAVIIVTEVPLGCGVDGFAASPTHGSAGRDNRRPFLAEGAVGLVVAVTDSGTRRLGRHDRSYPHWCEWMG
jgi:hypothetical protein